MIVVDTSALLTIVFREADMPRVLDRLTADVDRQMSVANYVEAGTVMADRHEVDYAAGIADLDRLIADADILLVPVDEAQARIALEARIRFGKGFHHPARLNYGDCFAYALAKVRAAPLLFVGDDFGRTDIVSALA